MPYYNKGCKSSFLFKTEMPKGRPGGNPNITDYSFTSDREYPLTKRISVRVDEPTKEKLKAGKLPGWSKIAREAVEKALAEVEEKERLAAEQDLKSA